jgi:hypothetical protein
MPKPTLERPKSSGAVIALVLLGVAIFLAWSGALSSILSWMSSAANVNNSTANAAQTPTQAAQAAVSAPAAGTGTTAAAGIPASTDTSGGSGASVSPATGNSLSLGSLVPPPNVAPLSISQTLAALGFTGIVNPLAARTKTT